MPQPSQSLTVKEVAAHLNCSRVTAYRRIHEGDIPHYRVGGLIRVRAEDLAALQQPAVGNLISELVSAAPEFTDKQINSIRLLLHSAPDVDAP